ncbi:MAG: CHASE2 domain-containing protein [Deltaproteobacteria bacterium]|nr:CHASE2 domain-containing protein [Deltaproteobacteria bacterium]
MKAFNIKKSDLLAGLLASALFIGLSFGGLTIFEYLERIVYGAEMRLDLPQNLGRNRIAIVNIDEKSLMQLGPWPWPRYLFADMVSILKNNGARLIGFDLIFPDKEQNQGLNEIKKLQADILERETVAGKDVWLMDTLKNIERRLDNDRILAQKMKDSGNIILPVIGHFGPYDTEKVLVSDSSLQKHAMNINEMKGNGLPFISVNELTAPFEELSKNSKGLGHINLSPNKNMKGRVHLLFIDYRGHVIPSMPLRIALDYMKKRPQDIIIGEKGIRLSGFQIPAVNGEIFIKFKGGRRSFPYYSFIDILNVKKVPAVFDKKVVLIGYTAEGGASIDTPVDHQMPRVELTANIIDNLLNSQYLKRPYAVIYIEGVLLLLVSLIASTALPRLSFFNRLGATVGMIFIIFLIGVLCFIFLDTWFKIIYISLALVSIFVFHGIKDIVVKQR